MHNNPFNRFFSPPRTRSSRNWDLSTLPLNNNNNKGIIFSVMFRESRNFHAFALFDSFVMRWTKKILFFVLNRHFLTRDMTDKKEQFNFEKKYNYVFGQTDLFTRIWIFQHYNTLCYICNASDFRSRNLWFLNSCNTYSFTKKKRYYVILDTS